MRLVSLVVAASLAVSTGHAMAVEELDDAKLVELWSSQKAVCKDGDEKSPDTWMACGRSDAFAAVLAARGFCLDEGQDVWRVGNGKHVPGESIWRCSFVSS